MAYVTKTRDGSRIWIDPLDNTRWSVSFFSSGSEIFAALHLEERTAHRPTIHLLGGASHDQAAAGHGFRPPSHVQAPLQAHPRAVRDLREETGKRERKPKSWATQFILFFFLFSPVAHSSFLAPA